MKVKEDIKYNPSFGIHIDDNLLIPYYELKNASPAQKEIPIEINEIGIDNIEECSYAAFFQNKLKAKKRIITTDNFPEKYFQIISSYYIQEKGEESKREIISRECNNSITLNQEKDSYDEFVSKHESIIKSMLMFEINESGIINPSEEYFTQMLDENSIYSMNLICKIFREYIKPNGREVNLLVSILHMLSHFKYEQVFPIAQTIASSAFNHENAGVCEYAIKCFENWEHPEGIKDLSTTIFYADWLQKYANMVIKELEEVKENVVISQENIAV